MVELMICVTILSGLTAAVFGIAQSGWTARQRIEDRLDACEAAAAASRSLREDVAFAMRVEIADEGRSLRLERFGGEDAAPARVTWILSGDGRLVRTAAENRTSRTEQEPGRTGAAPERKAEDAGESATLCRDVSEGSFAQTGRAVRLRLTIARGDGLTTWRQTFEVWAAPLTP
jgi:hypothetical protein